MTPAAQQDPPRVDCPVTADLAAAAQLRYLNVLREGLEHDLRSPLNSIVLNVALLGELIGSAKAADADALLDRLGIVRDATSRLEAGLAALMAEIAPPGEEEEVFDLDRLISEVGDLVAPQVRQLGLDLVLDAAPRAPSEPLSETSSNATRTTLRVRGCRDAVRQAIIHLVVNAIQVSDPGSGIELRTARRGTQAVVEVTDYGAGIEPASAPHVFDLYYSTKDAAAGIGLPVARRLLEANGGTLELTRSDSSGSVFTVALPEVVA